MHVHTHTHIIHFALHLLTNNCSIFGLSACMPSPSSIVCAMSQTSLALSNMPQSPTESSDVSDVVSSVAQAAVAIVVQPLPVSAAWRVVGVFPLRLAGLPNVILLCSRFLGHRCDICDEHRGSWRAGMWLCMSCALLTLE